MTLENCDKNTRNELMRLFHNVQKQIFNIECERRGVEGSIFLPEYVQKYLDFLQLCIFETRENRDSVHVPDDLVEFISDYEMIDFYDELEEMQYYNKLKIVR